MYSRTPRVFGESTVTTAPHIGPGYYQDDAVTGQSSLHRPPVSQEGAPFSSITPRVCYFDEVAKKSGPAPGSYEFDQERTGPPKAVPFGASSTPRFLDPPAKSPGPGAYDTSHRAEALQGLTAREMVRDTQQPEPHHIQWKRKFVPPSIPYGSLALGYDETADGELVLRQPQTNPNAAANLPSHGDFVRANAGTAFAKSTTQRTLWKEGTTPSPGQYNVAAAWQAFKDKKPECHPTHESRCIRFGDYVINEAKRQAVPGPGSYETPPAPSSSHKKGAIISRAESRFISPTSDPFSTATNHTRPESLPGPGAYNVAEASKSRKPLHVATKPFNSSEPRKLMSAPATANASGSGAAAGGVPGPGNYSVATTLLKKPQATGRSRSAAAFGSAAGRFAELERSMAPAKALPGPASYDGSSPSKKGTSMSAADSDGGSKSGPPPQRMRGPTIKHQYRRGSDHARPTAFGSQQARFAAGGASPGGPVPTTVGSPPPGSYDVAAAYTALTRRQIRHRPPVGSRSPTSPSSDSSRAGFVVPVEGPGPGDYNPAVAPRNPAGAGGAVTAVFLSRQPRLPEAKHLHPAPNAYQRLHGIVRKTFNATIGGEHHQVGASVSTALASCARARRRSTGGSNAVLTH
ncbi:hypothetical protein BC828DRAFT_377939 [Blastocladiella britannica]|nr:hypothetical protein BC828DRAFT_377939 [Blastocladiella britannica]